MHGFLVRLNRNCSNLMPVIDLTNNYLHDVRTVLAVMHLPRLTWAPACIAHTSIGSSDPGMEIKKDSPGRRVSMSMANFFCLKWSGYSISGGRRCL